MPLATSASSDPVYIPATGGSEAGPRPRGRVVTNEPLHVASSASPAFGFREHTFRFLASGEDTAGSYSTMEIASPYDTGPRPHIHAEAEESFFLLDGEVMFEVAGTRYNVKPGGFVHVPRGTVHHFRVLSPSARMIATYAPAGEEQGFREVATPLDN